MKESEDIDLSLTKQEVDLILNLIHNRNRPHTALSFDLETKLRRSLGQSISDSFGRPICGKEGCFKLSAGRVQGSLSYETCEEHRAEIERLVDRE